MFPKRLKKLRKNKKLKQEELGNFLGLSASTIGMYEHGRRSPDNKTLIKISNYFDVSADYLLGKTEIKNYENLEKQIFGKRLKQLRENANITQEELGKKVNLVKSNISMYEKGKRTPSVEILEQMSNIFDVSIDYLLGKTEIKKYNTPFNSNTEKKLFEKIKKMSEEQKKKILDVINIFFPDDEV